MPRRPRPLDPDSDPIHRFAQELREIHRGAGKPTRIVLARKMNCSHATVSHILNGDRFPSWENTAALVRACNEDPEKIRALWLTIDRQLEQRSSQTDPSVGEDRTDPKEKFSEAPARLMDWESRDRRQDPSSSSDESSARIAKMNADLSYRKDELRAIFRDRSSHNGRGQRFLQEIFEKAGPKEFSDALRHALENSRLPSGVPSTCLVSYRALDKQAGIERELPPPDVISTVAQFKQVGARGGAAAVPKEAAELKAEYLHLIASVALRTVVEALEATPANVVDEVSLSGVVKLIDESSAKERRPTILALCLSRDQLRELLERSQSLSPLDAVHRLGGIISPHAYELEPIERLQVFDLGRFEFVESTDVATGLRGSPFDLISVPEDQFEHLVRQLLDAMALPALVTKPSRGEVVDIVAVDERPIFGGLYVIQVKRYSRMVGAESVHALAGIMQTTGADKGIIIASSRFSGAAQSFATKHGRIEMIDGVTLCRLLKQYLDLDARPPVPPSST